MMTAQELTERHGNRTVVTDQSAAVFRPTHGPTTMDLVAKDRKDRKDQEGRTGERTTEPLTPYLQRVKQRVRAFDRRHPRLWTCTSPASG